MIGDIRLFYKNMCPAELDVHARTPDSPEAVSLFEERHGKLPDDLKYFLLNADFHVQLEFNFTTLSIHEIEGQLAMMNGLLKDGTFDGWVESRGIEESNYGIREGIIKKCWWNGKWIPFAEDGCGNLKCLDLDPAQNGTGGQVIEMENQDGAGPNATAHRSFTEYMAYHLELLVQNKYEIDSDGLISIDPYK